MARHVKQAVSDTSTLDYISLDDDAVDWDASRSEVQATPEEIEKLTQANDELKAAMDAGEQGRVDALTEARDKLQEEVNYAVLVRKKAEHMKDWDLSKLVYLKDREPTIWVFRHPRRRDIRNWLTNAAAALERNPTDVAPYMMEGCGVCVLGKREGLRGKLEILPVDGTGQKLSNAYLQALHDSDLVGELSSAILAKSRTMNIERMDEAKKNSLLGSTGSSPTTTS